MSVRKLAAVSRIVIVTRRELRSYFTTPLAYLFLAVFVMLSSFLCFQLGDFFRREQADLLPFFSFHPWLYLVLMPPLAMRLWAEERRSGTIELLMTLPLSTLDLVVGKFLAAWLFSGVALLATAPIWQTVNYLGDPDNGIILAAYLGSWCMGGAFLALGSLLSALTKNQVIAFVMALFVSLLFLLLGFGPLSAVLSRLLPEWLAGLLISMSFLTHFQDIARGVLDVRDVGFFLVFIVTGLLATVAAVEWKRAE
ncbi:ABC transporter permease subunit [Pseudomaricurvus sp. HS19]|uniref:ABC transporter permease subunit n=1 Tax=Pseudomaricurvus sp. HS19 TaxID=2692626 RepID=UPI001927D22C|nr:ABC transporter permease subunit [Pseudomaricurvus sp. HS19]